MTPKGGEVEPVEHGADVGPAAAGPGGLHDRLARPFRHIEKGVVGVVQADAMQRQEGTALERPLVGAGQTRVVADRSRVCRCEVARDLQRLPGTQAFENLTAVGEDGRPQAADGEAVDGTVAQHSDEHALGRQACAAGRLGGRNPRRRQIEHRQPHQPLFGREAGHPRVHHDDARKEPAEEEHAAGDAEPAVRVDEHPAPVERQHQEQFT